MAPQDSKVSNSHGNQSTPSNFFPSNPSPHSYENIVFQGGNNKLIAFCGAVKALEEEGIWREIRRLAGSGSSAILACLLSLGFSPSQILEFSKFDMHDIIKDKPSGSNCFCCLCGGGLKSGKFLTKWLGSKVKEASGKSDLTFSELFTQFKKELCIISTNLNSGEIEFIHYKTFPSLPIIQAVSMSLAKPPFLQPIKLKEGSSVKSYVSPDFLCDFPIYVFDGWFLSLENENSFLNKIIDLNSNTIGNKFQEFNDKTIGFITCHDSDLEFLKVSPIGQNSKVPANLSQSDDSSLLKNSEKILTLKSSHVMRYNNFVMAANQVIKVLKETKKLKSQDFTKEDAHFLINKNCLTGESFDLLFGTKTNTPEELIKAVTGKRKKKEPLKVEDVYNYFEKKRHQIEEEVKSLQETGKIGGKNKDGGGKPSKEIIQKNLNFVEQFQNLNHIFSKENLKNLFSSQPRNVERVVMIDTQHINHLTDPKKMNMSDRSFLFEKGKTTTKEFLSRPFKKGGVDFKEQGGSYGKEELKNFIDDDISEVIDEKDYQEGYIEKVV